ncbi:hypothetical protein [Curtobacterium sp. MCBA15_001]|uniref:hypothetical protein n=1 Tax=Curtobacterium sp. MCBA15_001 TaxID=1898731 RepID=UPI001114604D|nr:hypothetical protein [Curtobacterium sp. MCBA15_001]
MNKNKKLATIVGSSAAAVAVIIGAVFAVNLSAPHSTHGGPDLKAGTTQTSGPDLNAGSTAPSATATTPAASASSEPAADNSGDWASGVGSVTLNVNFKDGQTSATMGGKTITCDAAAAPIDGATASGASFTFASAADKAAQKNATDAACLWSGDAMDDFFQNQNG